MSKNLVAPRYQSAKEYHAPKPAPFEFGVDTVSIQELMDAPATRELVLKHAPWVGIMANSAAFQPYTSIFTLRDIAHFLPMDVSGSIADVDAALRGLPRSEWPADVR